MATFGNILARKGGTAQTGLEVTFTLSLPGADRNSPRTTAEATALLVPVTVTKRAAAMRSAEAYVDECEQRAREDKIPCEAPTLDEEKALRFIVQAMRDPADARLYFVANSDLDAFRDSLVIDQILFLSRKYNELIQREYAELRPEDTKKMREQAKDAFTKA